MTKMNANYKVSVYLVTEIKSYRLRFYCKETGKFLSQFEQRFNAISYDAALQKRDEEQAKQKWLDYKPVNRVEQKEDFISYFEEVRLSKDDEGTRALYHATLLLFKLFIGGSSLPFNKINKRLSDEFSDFLLKTKAKNTASCRFDLFAHVINRAFDDKLIERFKLKRISSIKLKRDVLTEEDINKFIEKTGWENKYKSIFLFECLTTISYDDMKELKWKQIEKKTAIIEGKERIVNKLGFKRGKTDIDVSMLLSDEIMQMIGDRKADDDYIFPHLTSLNTFNTNIKKLIKESDIKKYITSHRGRATGIIRIIESVGIYEASQQAGHAHVKTTEAYAQTTDKMMYCAQNALMSGIKLG